jgi:transcription antitermination factor NusG
MNYQIGQHVGFVDLIDRGETELQIRPTAHWFCAVTNPNCQARAALGLYELGYRTFYPKVRRWVSHARTKTAKERPLLGRYIFVEVDQPLMDGRGRRLYEPVQSFGEVRGVNGVEGFVSNPDPVRIPRAFVERFRQRYMAGEWDEVAKGPLPLGARIKIVEGEFNDMLATVTKVKGKRVDFKLHGESRYGRMNECSVRAA